MIVDQTNDAGEDEDAWVDALLATDALDTPADENGAFVHRVMATLPRADRFEFGHMARSVATSIACAVAALTLIERGGTVMQSSTHSAIVGTSALIASTVPYLMFAGLAWLAYRIETE
jgi:hypothetical protein